MTILTGLRVLDASRILAGPLAAQILGDMGAEVLKIEPPDGDATRGWGPPFQDDMATYFQSVNRNKVSLSLDLKSEAGRARFLELASAADVLIHNYLPSTRAKFGLTREVITERFPDLVAMGISGYREGTSRADEPGYDVKLQAESGIMSLIGPPEGPPYKIGVAWIDVLTGMMAANGALAALFRRERTGGGAFLGVSLYQTALFSLINVGSSYHLTGEEPVRHGNAHPTIVPYQLFQLRDRPLVIAVGNDRQYAALCQILGLEVDHPTNRARVIHRAEVLDRLEETLTAWDSGSLLEKLEAARVPAARVQTVAESFTAARAWDPDAVIAIAHNRLGEIKTTGFPVTGFPTPTQSPPPDLDDGGEALAERWLGSR